MWKIKREVGVASVPNNTDLRKFLFELGASIESLIDATPFGVSTPEPWSPSTDKNKALLSNPVSVLNETTSKAVLFGTTEEDSWTLAPGKLLTIIREGLANVAPLEETFECDKLEGKVPADVFVPSDCDAYVDLGADRWGNTERVANPLEEAVFEAKKIKSTIVAFIGKVQQCVSGLAVTSDDSDCSLFSLAENHLQTSSPPGSVPCDEDDFEDIPSVETEIAMEEASLGDDEDPYLVTSEVVAAKEDQLPEIDNQKLEAALANLVDDEEEWVLT